MKANNGNNDDHIIKNRSNNHRRAKPPRNSPAKSHASAATAPKRPTNSGFSFLSLKEDAPQNSVGVSTHNHTTNTFTHLDSVTNSNKQRRRWRRFSLRKRRTNDIDNKQQQRNKLLQLAKNTKTNAMRLLRRRSHKESESSTAAFGSIHRYRRQRAAAVDKDDNHVNETPPTEIALVPNELIPEPPIPNSPTGVMEFAQPMTDIDDDDQEGDVKGLSRPAVATGNAEEGKAKRGSSGLLNAITTIARRNSANSNNNNNNNNGDSNNIGDTKAKGNSNSNGNNNDGNDQQDEDEANDSVASRSVIPMRSRSLMLSPAVMNDTMLASGAVGDDDDNESNDNAILRISFSTAPTTPINNDNNSALPSPATQSLSPNGVATNSVTFVGMIINAMGQTIHVFWMIIETVLLLRLFRRIFRKILRLPRKIVASATFRTRLIFGTKRKLPVYNFKRTKAEDATIAYWTSMVATRTTTYGENHPRTAQAYFDQGQCFMKVHDYKAALRAFLSARFVWQQHDGPHSLRVAKALDASGQAMVKDVRFLISQFDQDRYGYAHEWHSEMLEHAQDMLEEAYRIQREIYNETKPVQRLVPARTSLTADDKPTKLKRSRSRHKFQKLASKLTVSIPSSKGSAQTATTEPTSASGKSATTAGPTSAPSTPALLLSDPVPLTRSPDHVDCLETYNKLASVKLYLEEYELASLMFKRVMLQRHDWFGRQHPSVAIAAQCIANAYVQCGDHGRAIKYFNHALHIYQHMRMKPSPNLIRRLLRSRENASKRNAPVG